jgi:hypothetical protein
MLTNKFSGQCHECFKQVPAGTGKLERSAGAPGWLVMHLTRDDCDKAKPMPSSGRSRRRYDEDYDPDGESGHIGIFETQG